MFVLKIITTILNLIFALIMIFFQNNLKWSNKQDRPSIIGFWGIVILYFQNIFCMWA